LKKKEARKRREKIKRDQTDRKQKRQILRKECKHLNDQGTVCSIIGGSIVLWNDVHLLRKKYPNYKWTELSRSYNTLHPDMKWHTSITNAFITLYEKQLPDYESKTIKIGQDTVVVGVVGGLYRCPDCDRGFTYLHNCGRHIKHGVCH